MKNQEGQSSLPERREWEQELRTTFRAALLLNPEAHALAHMAGEVFGAYEERVAALEAELARAREAATSGVTPEDRDTARHAATRIVRITSPEIDPRVRDALDSALEETGPPPLVVPGIPALKALARDYLAAQEDLVHLANHGALAGVAEVIRERRRQVEKGYTAVHDDAANPDGGLMSLAEDVLAFAIQDRRDGTASPAGDEEGLREAGALCAAEIDRLNRLVTPA